MSKPEPENTGPTLRGHQSNCLATSEDFRLCPPVPKPGLIPLPPPTVGVSTLLDDEPLVNLSNPLIGARKETTRGESLNTCQRRQGSEPLSEVDSDQVTAHICLSGYTATVSATVCGIPVTCLVDCGLPIH